TPPQPDRIDAWCVDLIAVEHDGPGNPAARHPVVHAVQAAEKRALAAAARPDEGYDRALPDLEVDASDTLRRSVVHRDIARCHFSRSAWGLGDFVLDARRGRGHADVRSEGRARIRHDSQDAQVR